MFNSLSLGYIVSLTILSPWLGGWEITRNSKSFIREKYLTVTGFKSSQIKRRAINLIRRKTVTLGKFNKIKYGRYSRTNRYPTRTTLWVKKSRPKKTFLPQALVSKQIKKQKTKKFYVLIVSAPLRTVLNVKGFVWLTMTIKVWILNSCLKVPLFKVKLSHILPRTYFYDYRCFQLLPKKNLHRFSLTIWAHDLV